MGEPRHLTSQTTQPIGWPTHKYQFCLKTVMPQRASGANMTMLKDIKPELLPRANNKLAERWRARLLPPIITQKEAPPQPKTPENRQPTLQRNAESAKAASHSAKSDHLDIRPPSAYSTSIKISRPAALDWAVHHRLDMVRLRAHLREHTYHPGNFSTLYKTSKQQMYDLVNRLSYDPYERREQLLLTENPDTEARLYTKAEIDAIVERLATLKELPKDEQTEKKKPASKELSPKEKEIVDRLTRVEQKDSPSSDVDETSKKTVTKAQLEEILSRLTQKKPEQVEQIVTSVARQVSAAELETILSRLMTFDSEKWPPESKPHIYKLHAKDY